MIILPKQDKNGNYYISYSQINAWNDLKGFNTGKPGTHEYIRSYFLGERYEQNSFATFGKEVEDYICYRGSKDKFDKREREVLNSIKPLGVFQHPIIINFDGYYLAGIIDDCDESFTKLRDYKTCSTKSAEKYYKDEYEQLDVYALGIKQKIGLLPKELEVCAIERTGNGFRGGRDVLKVGEEVWYIPRKTNEKRLNTLERKIQRTVEEISHLYKIFLKLNK